VFGVDLPRHKPFRAALARALACLRRHGLRNLADEDLAEPPILARRSSPAESHDRRRSVGTDRLQPPSDPVKAQAGLCLLEV
jgi:hypothetical protein